MLMMYISQPTVNQISLFLLSRVFTNKEPDEVSIIETPYGGRLVIVMPEGNMFYVHLKDNQLIRNKKRWSQVNIKILFLRIKNNLCNTVKCWLFTWIRLSMGAFSDHVPVLPAWLERIQCQKPSENNSKFFCLAFFCHWAFSHKWCWIHQASLLKLVIHWFSDLNKLISLHAKILLRWSNLH